MIICFLEICVVKKTRNETTFTFLSLTAQEQATTAVRGVVRLSRHKPYTSVFSDLVLTAEGDFVFFESAGCANEIADKIRRLKMKSYQSLHPGSTPPCYYKIPRFLLGNLFHP